MSEWPELRRPIMDIITPWAKCRRPEEWICDSCGRCGGECCGSLEMWHLGPETRCAEHLPGTSMAQPLAEAPSAPSDQEASQKQDRSSSEMS